MISGKEVYPLIEGGKGINSSDGRSSGAWAHENCVGTFSGVSPDFYDEKGNVVREIFSQKTREERHAEMIERAIKGGVAQAQIAHEVSNGNGRIHMNMLWEMADSQKVIEGVLERAKGLINGITCGAGMPFQLGELASKFGVYYYPIVSSARAFNILWKRAYSRFTEFLGGVVYEDPWLAGGHNGLSNAENPEQPEAPYNRLVELRRLMNSYGLDSIPIILAGGIWSLNDWKDYIDNPDIGKIAFQFGTRPMITKESPVSEAWQKVMMQVKKGDVILQRFSPTGFFSSAIKNTFLEKLINRKKGEISFKREADTEFSEPLKVNSHKTVFIKPEDKEKAMNQINAGLTEIINNVQNVVGFDEELVAFVDGTMYAAIQNSPEISKHIVVSDFKQGDLNLKVKSFNGIALIPVPDSRMKSEYTFAENGFTPTETAKNVRAIVLPKKGCHLVKKTETMRIFTPEQNKDADAYVFNYRLYYDAFVKKSGMDAIWSIVG